MLEHGSNLLPPSRISSPSPLPQIISGTFACLLDNFCMGETRTRASPLNDLEMLRLIRGEARAAPTGDAPEISTHAKPIRDRKKHEPLDSLYQDFFKKNISFTQQVCEIGTGGSATFRPA